MVAEVSDDVYANGELVAAVADSYAQIAGLLAGLAAAGIIVYLTRQAVDGRQGPEAPPTSERKPIGSRHVVRSLFFAMSALAICSFLYASAIDDAISPGRLALEMMFYGAALGTSVLALFYAVALMMLEHQVTRVAAASAYWMLVVVGPAVVLRFIAGAAYEGWRMANPSQTSWSSPLLVGSAYAVLLALGLLWVVSYGMPTRLLRSLRDKLRARPVAPAVAAFSFAAAGGLLSVFVSPATPDYVPHWVLSWAALFASSVAVTYFAFACVSVLGERIGGDRSLPVWSEQPAVPRRQRRSRPDSMTAAGRQ
jgi:MFS family permease